MTSSATEPLRRLPLHSYSVSSGAKMGAFGAWEVPLYYSTILEEHEAVRSKAGLFDISHMGEFRIKGAGTVEFLQKLLPRDVSKMTFGQALYMPLLNEEAGIIDDILLYRIAQEEYFFVVNAGNVDKDFAWIKPRVPQNLQFENLSEHYGLLALQGPLSVSLVKQCFGEAYTKLAYYHFQAFQDGMISRTGYTGEDGFEIMAAKEQIPGIWDKLMAAGSKDGLKPIGFGARDTLRLEAGMPLHGHDMSEAVNPLEASIGWAIDFTKTGFTGEARLREVKASGPVKKRVGFEMLERGIPREHYEIRKNGALIGEVTSGTFSPTLKKNIGLGYVSAAEARAGNEIGIVVRDKTLNARIVPLPFYKRQK